MATEYTEEERLVLRFGTPTMRLTFIDGQLHQLYEVYDHLFKEGARVPKVHWIEVGEL